ncbi:MULTISPECIES: AAA family ATPase [unclassified Mycobacterium]|uniref:AAA family ATPase n=1 Tax=unclassified Mycobacterium TaxID=2642494 RepID=UPI00099321DF|nr:MULTISPECIES: AAA family ATPase [unclassified Mycobacterium]
MADGSRIVVSKNNSLVGGFSVHLSRPDQPDIVASYEVDESLRAIAPSSGVGSLMLNEAFLRNIRMGQNFDIHSKHNEGLKAEQEYLGFLAKAVRTPLYLADDRSLYSDDPDIERIRALLSRGDERDRVSDGRLSRLAGIELRATVRRVSDYLKGLTLGGQSTGSANSNAIYMNVLRRMVEPGKGAEPDVQSEIVLLNELEKIASMAPTYETYELVPRFDVDEFRELIQQADRPELEDLVNRVVSPFVSSLRAQYEALRNAHDLLHAFVDGMNSFFQDKQLHFTPGRGVWVVSSAGDELDVEALSSGERQLLTLLSTTLLAREDSRLLIIDEPELSLGVEWQRNILDTLTSLTMSTDVQFFIATHSIEMMSSHSEALVQLVRQ